jgi:hypothetical protein
LPESAALVWEDLPYQQSAKFGWIVAESELFMDGGPSNLKTSWVAVVSQTVRRCQIILNLSSEVPLPAMQVTGKPRKQKKGAFFSEQDVCTSGGPGQNQSIWHCNAHVILLFCFATDCAWEINWQKIDLSNGFWCIIVGTAK